MGLHALGTELRKTVPRLADFKVRGEIVVRRRFSRTQVLRFTASLRVRLIGRTVMQSRMARAGWGTI
jgi:transposase